jgi:hypothetical protein
MWVRAVATVSSPPADIAAALGQLSPGELAGFAPAASGPNVHPRAHLGAPVYRGAGITMPIQWWTVQGASSVPVIEGELELQSQDAGSSAVAITGNYGCPPPMPELADSVFLRRMAHARVIAFLQALARWLEVETARKLSARTLQPAR